MILIIPFPKMLQRTTATMAASAISQLTEQLSMADLERVSPMATMIGPVTIGGKYFIIFFAENALISAAITR